MKKYLTAKQLLPASLALALGWIFLSPAARADLYWDANGTAPGAATGLDAQAAGTWGVDAFWSTDPDGNATPGAWIPGELAIFSAGYDATGIFTINVVGDQKVNNLWFEEGYITLEGGSITLLYNTPTLVADGLTVEINSVLDGDSFVYDGPGNLRLGGVNTYAGLTRINSGTVILKQTGALPETTDLTIGSAGVLDMSTASGRVASLAGELGGLLIVGSDQTLAFGTPPPGIDPASTEFYTQKSGGGLMIKEGSGTLTMRNGGIINDDLVIREGRIMFNQPVQFGGEGNPPSLIVVSNGATLRLNNSTFGSEFLFQNRSLVIGYGEAFIKVNEKDSMTRVHDATVISGPGLLAVQGPGEFRTYSVEHSFAKLRLQNSAFYTAGHESFPGYDTSFGAVPEVETPDAIYINNGSTLRKAGGANIALHPHRGIYLNGTNRKAIRSASGAEGADTLEIYGPITGSGPLAIPGVGDGAETGKVVLRGNNTYAKGTLVEAGELYVINDFTFSCTGPAGITVTNTALLGGEGAITGPVMAYGIVAPGYAYHTGEAPGTLVAKPVAKLAMGGLNLSLTGTYAWELGALSEANPGADYDLVDLTSGNLTLGGSSVLDIGFTGTATAPDQAEPFWRQSHQWKIITLSGGGAVSGNFSTITGTNGFTVGTFSTTADATGVTLVYTADAAPLPVTDLTIGPITDGNTTLHYSGGSGARFVLVQSPDVTAPMHTWTRVDTNTAPSGSFTFPVGADPKAFFRVLSE